MVQWTLKVLQINALDSVTLRTEVKNKALYGTLKCSQQLYSLFGLYFQHCFNNIHSDNLNV